MGIFTNLLTAHPELQALKNELTTADARFEALESENKRLKADLEKLRANQTAQAEETQFTSASGVLWKKKPLGKHESTPYCPTCKSTLSDYSGSLLCLKCNWQAPLKSFEVPKVYHDLFEPD